MGLHLFVIVFLLLRQKRISYFMGLSLSVYKTKDKIHYLKKIQSISTIRLSMPTGFPKRIFPFYERHRVAATQWGDTNEPFLHDQWWVTRRKEYPLSPDRNIYRRNRSRRLSSRFPVCSANLNTGDPLFTDCCGSVPSYTGITPFSKIWSFFDLSLCRFYYMLYPCKCQ